jgi:hypothetical protein
MAVNNVTGPLVAVLLLLFVLMRRPALALLVPISLIVFQDFGTLGVAALWAVVLVMADRRQQRAAARDQQPDDLVRPGRR